METHKKSAASNEKQKSEMGKERDSLLEELEQMKLIKVCEGSLLISCWIMKVTWGES